MELLAKIFTTIFVYAFMASYVIPIIFLGGFIVWMIVMYSFLGMRKLFSSEKDGE